MTSGRALSRSAVIAAASYTKGQRVQTAPVVAERAGWVRAAVVCAKVPMGAQWEKESRALFGTLGVAPWANAFYSHEPGCLRQKTPAPGGLLG